MPSAAAVRVKDVRSLVMGVGIALNAANVQKRF
jgi:hypothetical protein